MGNCLLRMEFLIKSYSHFVIFRSQTIHMKNLCISGIISISSLHIEMINDSGNTSENANERFCWIWIMSIGTRASVPQTTTWYSTTHAAQYDYLPCVVQRAYFVKSNPYAAYRVTRHITVDNSNNISNKICTWFCCVWFIITVKSVI